MLFRSVPIVRDIIRKRTKRDWIESLEAANVPCGPINNYQEVFEDPQVIHRGLKVDIPHPHGTVSTPANPMRFSETPITYEVPPPLLGQHTDEVLTGLLGVGAEEIAKLKAAGIV